VRNHDQKTKDMIESVLPSTARKYARTERRRIHHSRRAREAQALHRYLRAADYDYAADAANDSSDLDDLVWHRRAGDKVGPLTRWAVRRVSVDADLSAAPLTEQLDHFRAILPANLIGEHALFHIESALTWAERSAEWGRRAERRRTEKNSREWTRVLTDQVDAVLAAGRHAELNRRIKSAIAHESVAAHGGRDFVPTPHRLLLGAHDIDAFVHDVHRCATVRGLVADLAGECGPRRGVGGQS
jgi:hypothetical protein